MNPSMGKMGLTPADNPFQELDTAYPCPPNTHVSYLEGIPKPTDHYDWMRTLQAAISRPALIKFFKDLDEELKETFAVDPGRDGFPIFPRPPVDEISEDVLQNFLKREYDQATCNRGQWKLDEVVSTLAPLVGLSSDVSVAGFHDVFIPAFRELKAKQLVGGFGITYRSLVETEKAMPGILGRLRKERGKVVIVGCGLSEVMLLLADMHRSGDLSEPATGIDIFDLAQFRGELKRFVDRFSEAVKNEPAWQEISPPPLLHARPLALAKRIQEAVEAGDLTYNKLLIGAGSPRPAPRGANLIINCFGPPSEPVSCLAEQLQMLGVGGELATKSIVSENALKKLDYLWLFRVMSEDDKWCRVMRVK